MTIAAALATVVVTGTLVNAATVLAGTAVGATLGARFPDRMRQTVMWTVGLFVLVLGVANGLKAFSGPLAALTRGSALIVLGSLLVGALIGEAIDIDRWLNAAGDALKRRFGAGQSRFTEGFVVGSIVFCVGPLTILGSIQNGLSGDPSLLLVKSALDGFAALAFAAAMGWGVGFAVITILIYQGTLSIAASAFAHVFDPAMVASMTAVGGVMIIGIGLRLLELRDVRVANLLPAIVIAPVVVAVFEHIR